MEHIVIISLLHTEYISNAEKGKTKSSFCPDSDT